VGFVFVTTTTGYGGDVQIICGIGTDGKITKTATLAQSETQGISTPVFAKEPEYVGKDKNFKDSIDVVTGATLSSNAYRGGIQAAFEAFEIVKGVK
jgi:electron transport complex protein RnfG